MDKGDTISCPGADNNPSKATEGQGQNSTPTPVGVPSPSDGSLLTPTSIQQPPKAKRKYRRKVHPSYINTSVPTQFNFTLNNFENDSESKRKRKKIISRNLEGRKDIVFYNDRVEHYKGKKNCVFIKLENYKNEFKDYSYCTDVFLEIFGSISTLFESGIIVFLKNRNIKFQIVFHTARINKPDLTSITKRLVGLSHMTNLILPELESLDLDERYIDPGVLICPNVKELCPESRYRGAGNFTSESFPQLSRLILHDSTVNNLSLSFKNLKVLDMKGCSLVGNFLCSTCPMLEQINLSDTGIKSFESFSYFPALKVLNLENASFMDSLSLGFVPKLQNLNIKHCKSLNKIGFFNAPELLELEMSGAGSNKESCLRLDHLDVPKLQMLKARGAGIKSLPATLSSAKLIDLRSTAKLESISNFDLSSLVILDLSYSWLASLDIKVSHRLKVLGLESNNNLKELAIDSFDMPYYIECTLRELFEKQGIEYSAYDVKRILKSVPHSAVLEDEQLISVSEELCTTPYIDKTMRELGVSSPSSGENCHINCLLGLKTFVLNCPALLRIKHFSLPHIKSLRVITEDLTEIIGLRCPNLYFLEVYQNNLAKVEKLFVPRLEELALFDSPINSIQFFNTARNNSSNNPRNDTYNNPLASLRSLEISSLSKLESINLNNVPNLRKMRVDGCHRLKKITGCSILKRISVIRCDILETIDVDLPHAFTIDLSSLPSLKILDEKLQVPGLKSLQIKDCDSLKYVVLPKADHLVELDLSWCRSLSYWSFGTSVISDANFGYLDSLVNLPKDFSLAGTVMITKCKKLEKIQSNTDKVINLVIKSCSSFSANGLILNDIKSISIENCTFLEKIHSSKVLKNLSSLAFRSCPKLMSVSLNAPQLMLLSLIDCETLSSFTLQSDGSNSIQSIKITNSPIGQLILPKTPESLIPELILGDTEIGVLNVISVWKIGYLLLGNISSCKKVVASQFRNVENLRLMGDGIEEICEDLENLKSLTTINVSSLKKLMINQETSKNFRILDVEGGQLESVNIKGQFKSHFKKVCFTGELQLDQRAPCVIRSSVFASRLFDIKKMLMERNYVFWPVLVKILCTQLKSVTNVYFRRNIFDHSGFPEPNVTFGSDGYLKFPSNQDDLADIKMVEFTTSGSAPFDDSNRERSNVFLNRDGGNSYFETEEDMKELTPILILLLDKYKSSIDNGTYSIYREVLLVLYLSLNIPPLKKQILKEVFYQKFLDSSVLKTFKRSAITTNNSHYCIKFFHNFQKVVIHELEAKGAEVIRTRVIRENGNVSEADLANVFFYLSRKALNFLSENLENLNHPRCPICFDNEETNSFAYYRECGHSCCEECFQNVSRKKCFLCRSKVSSGTQDKLRTNSEVDLFIKVKKNFKYWTEFKDMSRSVLSAAHFNSR
ncbi:hypothetical protein DASC09_021170 [Saccharomycopsis crataegensis]|uniref:RING-type domain-containing protein n=1 Tax=Saccharomycopsis crataegensis TaxID=43959 RepID=A0AAV5QJQ5_9ASCO|nr:hypothetical protein DASC09_021170 [Saccharomycopsis crataegensis]